MQSAPQGIPRDGPDNGPASRRTALIAIALAAPLLIALYGTGSMILSEGADIESYPSGIYDMDVKRIVGDWTGPTTSPRIAVHPLSKLLLHPIGKALTGEEPAGKRSKSAEKSRPQRLRAVRLMILASMTANVLLVGWLTMQLCNRRVLPGVIAIAICGVSFSSLLLACLPENSSISCLASIAPLLFLNARMNRKFSAQESVGWIFLGVLGIGLTITQISHWVIALGVRIYFASAGETTRGRARLGALVTAICVGATALTWAGVSLQREQYRRAPIFYKVKILARESRWFRFDDIREKPFSHTARLLGHVALYDFAAPFPVYSDYLMQLYEGRWTPENSYWSLSLEEATPADWRAAQLPIFAGLAALLAAAASGVRRLDRRFIAPGLCVASQIGLHFLYGREYVLYSPNWHGVWVALLIAASFRGWAATRERVATLAAACLAIAVLVNNLAVLDHTYDEVRIGLDALRRDDSGKPLVEAATPR